MRNPSHRLVSVFTMILVLAMGMFVATMKQSAANQKASPGDRYEYRVLEEHGVGRMLEPSKNRNPFQPIEPPKELQEFLNKLGRDGWEIEDLRIRAGQSELKANRQAPGYYVYSDSGETGPRFLRLRRRLN